jgi:MFS family permease
VAQFAWSIWWWQFSIFLADLIDPWAMGIVFLVGTLASLIGFAVSGILSDILGRRKAMTLAFIPMFLGLVMLAEFPLWPLIPFEYALAQFGWSFILITARAMPADETASLGGMNAARRFTTVLMPAYLIDGVSPALASGLLYLGFRARELLLLGAVGAVVALISALLWVRETLSSDTIRKAKSGPIISFRGLGQNFWKLAAGMIGYSLIFNTSIRYYANLCVDTWGVSAAQYGLTWSAFSLTSGLLAYTLGGFADRKPKASLLLAVILNTAVWFGLAFGSGFYLLLFLNVVWAFPIMTWIGSERSLAVRDVENEMKGRALGTYQFLMSATQLLGAPMGAVIWDVTGSLRFLWLFSAYASIFMVVILAAALRSVRESD